MDADKRNGPTAPSEEPFRLLVESVKDYAIFLLDPGGVVTSWNEGARAIKGYTADEIIGQHFSIFYPSQDVARGKCEAELAKALSEGRMEDVGWRVRKDGSQFWATVVITALRDKTGRHVGFAKVTRDLTDRVYRTFVEATNAIVWTMDATGRPNADSPSWRAFTGQSESEWRGQDAGWNRVHPDEESEARRKWSVASANHGIFEAEYRLRRHDGVYIWMTARAVPLFDPDGAVREWFGVIFDVSARKAAESQAQRALERERTARIEAEKAESFWTTTLRSIGDAVVAADNEGRVTFMNPVAENVTGWSLEQARGKSIHEVLPILNEETRLPVNHPVERVLGGESIAAVDDHFILVRRDGIEVPIDESASPIRDNSGSFFGAVLVFRDMTKEKRASIRRAYLARASDALMASLDYRDALAAVVRMAVPVLADWCAVDILEPGDTAPTEIAVAHVDQSRSIAVQESGGRYLSTEAGTTGVLNVLRTGTSELYPEVPPDLFHARSSGDAIVLEDVRPRSAMIVPLQAGDRILGALTFAYATSGRSYGEDDLLLAEELARRSALIIERRRLERERIRLLEAERHAREQAELANRTKDNFLATVSHELRNPLQAISGWTEVLLRKEIPAELRKPLLTINRNARAQARLIEDVLDVSRIVSGKLGLEFTRFDLNNVIGDVLEAMRPAAEANGIRLVAHVAPGIMVYADQVRLQQVVTNLVSNAVKFTPSGGLISIDAEQLGSTASITVSDNGEGIDPAFLTQIFEPFRQADASSTRKHGGLGLGLAIVRQLVLAHGGTVRAESAGKGRGARFIIELPERAITRGSGPSATANGPQAQQSLSGIRVLAVDDQLDTLELVGEILRMAGATVTTASSATEALDKLQVFGPDVLVSDIGMPDIDGYGLIQRIRRLGPHNGGMMPAIALTAYAGGDNTEHPLTSGFQQYLMKPVDAQELVTAVAALVGIRREIQRPDERGAWERT